MKYFCILLGDKTSAPFIILWHIQVGQTCFLSKALAYINYIQNLNLM